MAPARYDAVADFYVSGFDSTGDPGTRKPRSVTLCLHAPGWGGVMTAGPGDDVAGCGQMRASGADRERTVDALKTAFAEERLTKDELDARAGQAYSARTYAELAAITADLPARAYAKEPAGKPRAGKPPAGRAKKAVLMGAALTFQPALFMIAILLDNGPLTGIVGISMSVYFIFLTVAGLGMIGQRLERSSGQLPPPVKPGQLPA